MGPKLFWTGVIFWYRGYPPTPPIFWCFKRTKNIIVYHFYIFRDISISGGISRSHFGGYLEIPKLLKTHDISIQNLIQKYIQKWWSKTCNCMKKPCFFDAKNAKTYTFFALSQYLPHEKSVKKCIFLIIFLHFFKTWKVQNHQNCWKPTISWSKIDLTHFLQIWKKMKNFFQKNDIFCQNLQTPQNRKIDGYPPHLGGQKTSIFDVFGHHVSMFQNIKFWYFWTSWKSDVYQKIKNIKIYFFIFLKHDSEIEISKFRNCQFRPNKNMSMIRRHLLFWNLTRRYLNREISTRNIVSSSMHLIFIFNMLNAYRWPASSSNSWYRLLDGAGAGPTTPGTVR